MPYRHAWLYAVALLALTFVAFWPSYLKNLSGGKLAWHFHAGSAVLWTILAAVQGWSIHHDRRALHRSAGLAVFALFPLFLVAGLWVVHVEATTLATGLSSPAGLSDPENFEISQFGFFDTLANIGFAAMFWGGLKYRYKVHLHARYMLGTLLFVVAPIVWRLLRGYVPAIHEMPFSYPFAAGNIIAIAIAIALYRQAPKHGAPFLLAAGFMAAQEILFETLGRLPGWAPIFASVSTLNLPVLLVTTAIISVGIAWYGWVAGARPQMPQAPATV
ncbi:MAG: hypothetical protein ABIR87_02850 [Sphingomicrobium sp.]